MVKKIINLGKKIFNCGKRIVDCGKKTFDFAKAKIYVFMAFMSALTATIFGVIRLDAKQARAIFAENRAENFVDSGIKILIAVVIGALLLGGLYALFGDTILPTLTEKVESMFEFKG